MNDRLNISLDVLPANLEVLNLGSNHVTDFQATCSVREDDFFSKDTVDQFGMKQKGPPLETQNQIGILGKIRSLKHLDLSNNRLKKESSKFTVYIVFIYTLSKISYIIYKIKLSYS